MADKQNGDDTQAPRPDSLLPYDEWAETALRQVMVRAILYAAEHGLPGEHHFYVTFRTDHPGTVIPGRLRMQYPQEMTIVLQHQFWNLSLDQTTHTIGVGLSFGGVPATLSIPLGAVTAFADPHVQFGLRFRPETPLPPPEAEPEPAPEPEAAAPPEPDAAPQVVSLDAFRRRGPGKDGGSGTGGGLMRFTVDRLDHVVLNVRDVAVSCAWYQRVLGMTHEEYGQHSRSALTFGGQKINVRPADADPAAWSTARAVAPGMADLCFVTAVGAEEIVAHLNRCGVAVELGPVARLGALGPMTSVYCRDPDGNLIEVATYLTD